MVAAGNWKRKKTRVRGNLVSIAFKISSTHRTISELTFVYCIGNRLPGASVRNSAHGTGHEKGGSAYAKAESSLRRPPVTEHLPPKPESACFTVLCFPPTLLTLTGAVPPPPFSGKS